MTIARPGGFDITDRALEIANYKMGSRILDIGCGEGDTVDRLNKMGLKAEGIDINLAKIDNGKKQFPGINIKFGDGTFLDDYMSYTFDGITMECALSMMAQPDETLHEAYCVLKKGGRFIITDFYEINPDPKQVKAVAIEADRRSRIPHNEGECESGTVSHFTDFCFEGAFYKEPLIRMIEDELGMHVTAFEDRTADLEKYIAEANSDQALEDLSISLKTEARGGKRRIGYFILVAQKSVM